MSTIEGNKTLTLIKAMASHHILHLCWTLRGYIGLLCAMDEGYKHTRHMTDIGTCAFFLCRTSLLPFVHVSQLCLNEYLLQDSGGGLCSAIIPQSCLILALLSSKGLFIKINNEYNSRNRQEFDFVFSPECRHSHIQTLTHTYTPTPTPTHTHTHTHT